MNHNLPSMLLDSSEVAKLKKSLYFLHVSELKDWCSKLNVCQKGKKVSLILKIIHFVETGQRLKEPQFPAVSCAQRGKKYRIAKESKILKGAYKNDLKTRLFFKEIIGNYFHFTAFGIDWIQDRWFNGKPATYQEFADMWQLEYQRRKENPAPAKQEWAYINFVQDYVKVFASTNREDIMKAWNKERLRHKGIVDKTLAGLL